MRLPWRSRAHKAEALADEAERALKVANEQRDRARKLAAEAARLRQTNGFTEAVRTAMGVER